MDEPIVASSPGESQPATQVPIPQYDATVGLAHQWWGSRFITNGVNRALAMTNSPGAEPRS
jgi:hypothetical protein